MKVVTTFIPATGQQRSGSSTTSTASSAAYSSSESWDHALHFVVRVVVNRARYLLLLLEGSGAIVDVCVRLPGRRLQRLEEPVRDPVEPPSTGSPCPPILPRQVRGGQ